MKCPPVLSLFFLLFCPIHLPHPHPNPPLERLCRNRGIMMFVILSEAKNLIISTESTMEILRLTPQNDITTQSLKGGSCRGNLLTPPPSRGRSGGGWGICRSSLNPKSEIELRGADRPRYDLLFIRKKVNDRDRQYGEQGDNRQNRPDREEVSEMSCKGSHHSSHSESQSHHET